MDNQEFLTVVGNSFKKFLETGSRSNEKLKILHAKAHGELGINAAVEPVMTLTFMSLPVIPEIKLTTRGLFDYETFAFIPVEATRVAP